MAEILFNTRFQQKYGTHAEWTAANPTPKQGELCVVVVPAETGAVVQEPTILFKVGDGINAYNDLNFTGAVAADVYDWAKAKDKPAYSASEISGIGSYIAEYVEDTLGISVDTDTQYRINKVDDYTYKLQSKAKGEADTAFADVSTIVIPKYDDTGVTGRISALETLVGSTAVATQISNAIAELDLANTYAAKSHTHTASEITDLDTTIKGYDYATKSEAQGYADAKDEAIAAAKKSGDDAQAGVDTLVGSVEGDDAKSARTIAQEEAEAMKDAILGEGIKGTFDTLKEVQDWIEGDGVNATELTSAIAGEAAIREQADADLGERIDAIDNHSHANKTVLDGITAEKVSAWDAAEQNAKDYADDKVEELDNSLAAIAKTGNVADLIQNSGDVIVFNCGGPAIGTADEYTNA